MDTHSFNQTNESQFRSIGLNSFQWQDGTALNGKIRISCTRTKSLRCGKRLVTGSKITGKSVTRRKFTSTLTSFTNIGQTFSFQWEENFPFHFRWFPTPNPQTRRRGLVNHAKTKQSKEKRPFKKMWFA